VVPCRGGRGVRARTPWGPPVFRRRPRDLAQAREPRARRLSKEGVVEPAGCPSGGLYLPRMASESGGGGAAEPPGARPGGGFGADTCGGT